MLCLPPPPDVPSFSIVAIPSSNSGAKATRTCTSCFSLNKPAPQFGILSTSRLGSRGLILNRCPLMLSTALERPYACPCPPRGSFVAQQKVWLFMPSPTLRLYLFPTKSRQQASSKFEYPHAPHFDYPHATTEQLAGCPGQALASKPITIVLGCDGMKKERYFTRPLI